MNSLQDISLAEILVAFKFNQGPKKYKMGYKKSTCRIHNWRIP